MKFLLCLFASAVVAVSADSYANQIASFRAEREQSIKRDWLPLVGLHWLKEGDNGVPGLSGTLTLLKGNVHFRPTSGKARDLKDEALTEGTSQFTIIRRGDRVGVRVKDSAAPRLHDFKHLSWFAVDPGWRVTANFTPWDKPHKLVYDTVIPGLREDFSSPGYITFRKNNVDYKLEPVEEDGELFYVFRDRTAGKSTYPAARYLYSEMPKNGTVVLDFNKATNPPCAFTDYATCPLPPPQNRLQIEIPAGETYSK